MPRNLLRPLPLAIALTALSACGPGGDRSLYVKDDTSKSWFLAVDRTAGDFDYTWVVEVEPGADASALSWDHKDTDEVRVLDADCSVVGTFRSTEDGTWVVDAAPGLTASVKEQGPPLGSRTTTPGVSDTEECGGTMSG